MAKATERFKVVTSSEILVTEVNKSAVKVELQYGRDGKLPEIVIAEMYNKEGEWCYTRSQVRLESSKDNAKFLIDGINSAYKESSKVKKDAPKNSDVTISTMTTEQKAELLKMLLEENATFTNTLLKKGGKIKR